MLGLSLWCGVGVVVLAKRHSRKLSFRIWLGLRDMFFSILVRTMFHGNRLPTAPLNWNETNSILPLEEMNIAKG